MCQTSIDSNLGVLLRAGTDEKVPDKLVNTIRARKVPNNVTDVSFSKIRPSQVDDKSGNQRRAGNFTKHRSADFLDTVFLRTYIKNYY